MALVLCLLVLSALSLQLSATDCPEEPYDANVPWIKLVKRKYPFTSLRISYSFEAYGGDPCRMSLVGKNFGLNQLEPDLFDKTRLGQTLCAKKCQTVLTYYYIRGGPICNTSAPSPTWNDGRIPDEDLLDQFNCHDLKLPEFDGPLDFYMTIPVGFIDELDGLMSYLSSIHLNKVSLNWWQRLSEQQVKSLLHKVKTAKQLTLDSAYSKPDLEQAAIDGLSEFDQVESFSLQHYKRAPEALDAIPNPDKLLHLQLFWNALDSLPSPQLSRFSSLLRLDIGFNPNVNLNDLPTENLKNLEIAVFMHTNTSSIGSQFLPQSKNLVLLDLTCNSIEEIAPDAFCHLRSLRVLRLTGNLLTNLPSTLFHPLGNLQMLDLRGGVAERHSYGLRIDYNIHDSNSLMSGLCIFVDQQYQPSDGLESIHQDQLKGLGKLEHLQITNHRAELTAKTLEPVVDTLKFLNIEDMQIENLTSLELHKMCKLEQLILNNNPVGLDKDFISYEMVFNLRNLERLSIKNCNISRITGPLFLLTKAGVRASNYELKGLWGLHKQLMEENQLSWFTNVTKSHPCNLHTWKALERNTTAGVSGDCLYEYKQIMQEIELWKSRSHDKQYVQCLIGDQNDKDEMSSSDPVSVPKKEETDF